MKNPLKRSLFVFLVALLGGPPALAQLEIERHHDQEVVARTILVKFKPSARHQDIERMKKNEDIDADEGVGGINVRRLRSRTRNVAALLARFHARPDVEYAEPDQIVRLEAIPDDPDFSRLWGMQKISAVAAWDATVGSRANVVAVVDTGIDYTHPDLAANVWSAPSAFTVTIGGVAITCAAGTHGFNAITRSCDPRDDHFHGTHVSGTAGAEGNNAVGVAGVSWTASIMGAKFLNSSGTGSISNAINAIEFTIQAKAAFGAQANVRILSNSWACGGFGCFSQALRDQIIRANASDMLFTAAAGNSSSNNDTSATFPANYDVPNVLSVGASDSADQRASFSNYGSSVAIFAPGVDVWSTLPNNGYGFLSGTSMATPHVSGAAALILSRCPLMNTAELRTLLLQTADSVPNLNLVSGVPVAGLRLNADRAVSNCLTTVPTSTSLSVSASQVSPGQSVVLTATTRGTATGTIFFFDGNTLLGTATLANGTATLTTPGLSFGLHQFTANYSGDANHLPSASAASPVMAGTISSVSLKASSLNISPGQTVTLTVTVSGDSPSGTVTFFANGASIDSRAVMNGIASLTTAPLPTGVYQFTASYGGDVNNTPSSTAAAIVVTAKTTSSTSLAASAARIDPEQTVTLTMTVSGQSPTGTVSIFDNGVLVGTAALTAGTAVFTTTELGFGFHNFTVRYDGDANNFSSTIAAPTVVAVGNVEAVLAIILMLLDD